MLILHEILFVPVRMNDSEKTLWKEEISQIKTVKMDNLKVLPNIRRMDRILNARIRELCRVKKGLNERIDEGMLQWFGHVERMKKR